MFHRSAACLVMGLRLAIVPLVAMRTSAQEIPLEHCDALPVIPVEVNGRAMRFLVDTAATSLLNAQSFSEGRDRDVRITSWRGTQATSAREVSIREMVVGRTKLMAFRLPAVDLTAIGQACGRKIDGVLGVDLLAKLGADIDLKRQTMRLSTVEEQRGVELAKEVDRQIQRCVEAFNEADERFFTECLEPQFAFFIDQQVVMGRAAALRVLCEPYWHGSPATMLKIHESAVHPIGEAVWYEFEFTIDTAGGSLHGRCMSLWRKSNGRWRMASMHDTMEPPKRE
jgi:Domain of unknown function (DUF4440)/Aspartyl protease